MNLIPFPKLIDVELELDSETVRALDELAVDAGTSRDLIIEEALQQFLDVHEIGDDLLTHLGKLSEIAASESSRKAAIDIWRDRVQKNLDDLGK